MADHLSKSTITSVLFVVLCLCNTAVMARPYRSTQGVLRTRPSLNEFLNTYLQAAQQRAEPQYGYAEYQPSYQQGYISHRPRRTQNLEPFMQYLNSPEMLQQQDYANYDLHGSDSVYSDNDGEWYDEPSNSENVMGRMNYGPQAPAGDFLGSEPTEQDLALAQLMLDHVAGKYSLDDLETLEREARSEENTENQLRALTKKVHHKKSVVLPYMGSAQSQSALRSSPRRITIGRTAPRMASSARRASDGLITLSQRRGQKEEPVMVPATSVRRPIFVEQLEQNMPNSVVVPMSSSNSLEPFMKKKDTAWSSAPAAATSPSSTSETVAIQNKVQASLKPSTNVAATIVANSSQPRSGGVVEVVKVKHGNTGSDTPSTMGPYVQSAYESFKKYLDTQRQARMSSDQELLRSPQKRFVQDNDPLPRELNNLKKSVA